MALCSNVGGFFDAGIDGSTASDVISVSYTHLDVYKRQELSGALVEPFEGDVDTEDLTKYLESAVIRFNQESGAEGTARNKQGADRLPAALNLSLIHI